MSDGTLQGRWVEGLRAGQDGALAEVFVAYRPSLRTFLVRLTGGQPELAEDLLQETFLRLAVCARRLRRDSNLGGWLFTVARNLWRSYQRGRSVDRLAERADAAPPRRPDDEHALRTAVQQLDRALTALSPPLREVAELVLVEEWTQAEVAAHLALPQDTVRQRICRARRQIQEAVA